VALSDKILISSVAQRTGSFHLGENDKALLVGIKSILWVFAAITIICSRPCHLLVLTTNDQLISYEQYVKLQMISKQHAKCVITMRQQFP